MRSSLVFAVLLTASCGPGSIEQLCEDVAQKQCATCYSCEVDGATLCSLPAGADEATCQAEASERCAAQAGTLERPKEELQICIDSFDELTCDALVRSEAQDAPYTTDACLYFL